MKTKLLLGPPGTGKTTSLIGKVEKAIEQGIPSNRIAVLTFTKQAANEVVDRACKKFNLHRKQFPFFRTLHSLAFKSIGLTRNEVMTGEHFRDLGKILGGYDFQNDYDENIERVHYTGGLGDKCVALYGMAKATHKPLETVWKEYDDRDVAWPDLDLFARTLDRYKAEHNLFDFTDFLDRERPPLDVDLFILDEAQDLTRQQWNYTTKIWGNAQERWIAGDDDQAIFQWAGADVNYFQSLNAETNVLPVSYRLPESVWNLSSKVVSRIKTRFPKNWQPRPEKGIVQHIRELSEIDLSSGTWMILARHQYQLKDIVTQVRDLGLPYIASGKSSLEEPYIRAILAYETLRAGKTVGFNYTAFLTKFIPNLKIPPHNEPIGWDGINWPFPDLPDWMTAFSVLGAERRDYVRGLLRRGYNLKQEPWIRINTIHSTKGSEADNVVLFSDMSYRTFKNFMENPDPELRVWYVGITRAKQGLYIVDPQTTKFFDF